MICSQHPVTHSYMQLLVSVTDLYHNPDDGNDNKADLHITKQPMSDVSV